MRLNHLTTLMLGALLSIGAAGAQRVPTPDKPPTLNPSAPWISYKSPDGAFTFDTPRAPTVSPDSVTSSFGVLPMTKYVTEDGGVSMIILDSDGSNLQAELNVESAIKATQSDGRVFKSESVVQLDGHEGRYVIFSDGDGDQFALLIFIVGRHIYQALSLIPKDATPAQAAEAVRFVQSFHFPNQAPPDHPY